MGQYLIFMIYKLKLHESLEFEQLGRIYKVMRVPGGWIYQIFKDMFEFGRNLEAIVFVPFHNEFNNPVK